MSKVGHMRMATAGIQTAASRVLVIADQIFGLRAWGLILYGVLPSNLALLGLVKVDSSFQDKILHLLPALLLPVLVSYLLIRTRHQEWYLTRSLLAVRSRRLRDEPEEAHPAEH